MTNYGFKNIQVPGETRTCDIHLIYNSKRAMLNSREDIMKGVEAFRKVDFVVTHAYVPNAMAMYSDIVLPICTPWEGVGRIAADGSRDAVVFQQPVCAPLFESRSDQEIVARPHEALRHPGRSCSAGARSSSCSIRYVAPRSLAKMARPQKRSLPSHRRTSTPGASRARPRRGKYPLAAALGRRHLHRRPQGGRQLRLCRLPRLRERSREQPAAQFRKRQVRDLLPKGLGGHFRTLGVRGRSSHSAIRREGRRLRGHLLRFRGRRERASTPTQMFNPR